QPHAQRDEGSSQRGCGVAGGGRHRPQGRDEARGRAGVGAANGYRSGSTFTSVVNVKGTVPPLGKVSSTNAAVQPSAGAFRRATYRPARSDWTAVAVHTGPIVSSLKSRAFGLVACHNCTFDGRMSVVTVNTPS